MAAAKPKTPKSTKAPQRPGAITPSADATAADPIVDAPQHAVEEPGPTGEDLQAKANRLKRAQLGPHGWICPQPPAPKA